MKYKKHLTETGHDQEVPEVIPEVVEDEKVEANEQCKDEANQDEVTNVLDELSSFFSECDNEVDKKTKSENLVEESTASYNVSEVDQSTSENHEESSSAINDVPEEGDSVSNEDEEDGDEEDVFEDEKSSVADELVNFFAVDVIDDEEDSEEMVVDENESNANVTETTNIIEQQQEDNTLTDVEDIAFERQTSKNEIPSVGKVTNSQTDADRNTHETNAADKDNDVPDVNLPEDENTEQSETTSNDSSNDVLKKTEDLLESCKDSVKDIKKMLSQVKDDSPDGVRIEVIPNSSSCVADELASFLSDANDDSELEIEKEVFIPPTQAGHPKLNVIQRQDGERTKDEEGKTVKEVNRRVNVKEVSPNSSAVSPINSPASKLQNSSDTKDESRNSFDAGEVAKEFLAFIWERDIAGKVKRSGKYYDCLECGAQMDSGGFRTKETHGWGGQKEIFNHFKESHLKPVNNFKCPICDIDVKTFILYLDHLKIKHKQKPSLMKDVIEVQVNANNNQKRKVIEEIQLDDDDEEEETSIKPPENKKARKDPEPRLKPFNWHLEMMRRVTIKQKQIWCKLCNYTYSQNQSRALIVHMEVKHFQEFKQLPCNKCDTVCDSFTNFNAHMKRKHKEMKFTVNANKKSFFLYIDESSSLDIINESIVHTSVKPEKFTWQGEIMTRVQIADDKYRCSDCKFESKPMAQDGGKQILGHIEGVHMNIRGYQCPQCNLVIPNFIEFFKHLNQAHQLTLRLLQNIAL